MLVVNDVPEGHADILASSLVESDACGVTTHGIAILPAYIQKIKVGGFNLAPQFSVIREGGAFSVIDGDNAIGAVSAVHCMRYAMDRCKLSGVYMVFSRNNNTYGAGFYYPMLAAQEGFIGLAISNSPAAMPAIGGVEKLFGTNPFSVAIPSQSMGPIIFDMAASKVAKSKINEARIRNEKIPYGWALDEKGKPTNDPVEAIRGLLLPMEEHKGYGIALTIDILSGFLSGAGFLNRVGKFYSDNNQGMNVGHTFIVLDPKQIYGNQFYEEMDEYKKLIHGSESLSGTPVRIPGDQKMKNKQQSMRYGVAISEDTTHRLNKCLKEHGLTELIID